MASLASLSFSLGVRPKLRVLGGVVRSDFPSAVSIRLAKQNFNLQVNCSCSFRAEVAQGLLLVVYSTDATAGTTKSDNDHTLTSNENLMVNV